GRDDLDLAEPPPPGEHIRLSFLDGETRLGHSLQPDGGAGAAWEAEVAATPGLLRDGPLAVRVALEEMAPPPEGYGRWVLDLARTAALPLDEADGPGSGATFEVVLTPQAPTRRLRVIIGTEAFAAQAAGGIPLVPLDDALLPAYPNPTRRTASVPYQLAERGPVTLAVYDLLGRRIALLVDGEQDGGRHEARWDASGAASGVYVYRLQVGDFSATGKLLILR
ncbi:MAG: T9SS type A sorting domain-containing protein, partial [Rubricoccaceae bacterium]|nr:T9SS type A sorting domain-containing protein [Rubricoccaceae bacterium]